MFLRFRLAKIDSPRANHKRANSDVSPSGRLLPNYNLPNIDGEDDCLDMSPLKRLQRLKENGSLRLKGQNSKRTLNFPPDVKTLAGSDSSLSDLDGRRLSANSSGSDLSVDNSSGMRKAKGNSANGKEPKCVRFEDHLADDNGNNSNSTAAEVSNVKDSNGNISQDLFNNTSMTHQVGGQFHVSGNNEAETGGKISATGTMDVDSETGELKVQSPKDNGNLICTCNQRLKPAIPTKPPNLQRLKTRPASLNSASSNNDPTSPPPVERPKPITVISARNNGIVGSKGSSGEDRNVVTVQYTPVPKPVIEVKLIQRRETRSQTPSPQFRHHSSSKHDDKSLIRPKSGDDKWLSRSVDELDKPVDIYACPTSFLRDPSAKLRHSFVDRGITDKEREAIYNSVGDVQTLLRNSLVCEDEKIYSLPQPACYGDNTLKAVKKITEKYDTLQRRKLRALSFREGAKYSGTGVSFSQPSSPVSPTKLSGVQPPPPPSSPPPPLSAGASSVSSVFDEPDGLAPGTTVRRSPDPPAPPPRWSLPSTPTHCSAVQGEVTPKDVARLELFYHGKDTEIVVCQGLADLRFGTAVHSGSEEVCDWTPVANTGVPLLVLNTGKGKRRRELLVTLAERETGFPLWSDKINYLSNYRECSLGEESVTHAMQLSNNFKKVVGFTFHGEQAAKEFLDRFKELTNNPNDNLWKVSTGGKDGEAKKKRRPFSFKRLKAKKHSKTDISVPCNFSHITSVDPQDRVLQETLGEIRRQLSRSLPNTPNGSRPVSFASS